MNLKVNPKLLICAFISCIALQACASLMSRQQQVEHIEKKFQITVSPTTMPPVVSKKIQRLSIIYITPTEEYPFATSTVEIAVTYFKRQQADLTVIDRESAAEVQKEFAYQLTGQVSPATAAQLGKQLGADALLLIYFKPITPDDFKAHQVTGGFISAAVDLRLISVEEGTVLFRTNTSAWMVLPRPPDGKIWLPKTINTEHDVITSYAAGFVFASLAAAFGENQLGMVPDMDAGIQAQLKKLQPGVTLFGLLEGSPAQKSGLQRFDRIVRVDGRPITTWMDKIQIPANITVERDGSELVLRVQ
jgi:hypothetical protein